MFVESGHKRTFLENLVEDFNSKKSQLHQLKENPRVASIGPKFRKKIKKANTNIIFTSSKNLQGILTKKLLLNSHPGVYQLGCSSNARYIGE